MSVGSVSSDPGGSRSLRRPAPCSTRGGVSSFGDHRRHRLPAPDVAVREPAQDRRGFGRRHLPGHGHPAVPVAGRAERVVQVAARARPEVPGLARQEDALTAVVAGDSGLIQRDAPPAAGVAHGGRALDPRRLVWSGSAAHAGRVRAAVAGGEKGDPKLTPQAR